MAAVALHPIATLTTLDAPVRCSAASWNTRKCQRYSEYESRPIQTIGRAAKMG
jgi:hypothetical protein